MRGKNKLSKELRRKERNQQIFLTLLMTLVVFVILVWTLMLAAISVAVMIRLGVIGSVEETTTGYIILFMALISLLTGAIITFFAGRIPLQPINRWINHMHRLAAGDFNVRLHFGKPFGNTATVRALTDSFNKLAEELQKTEMLRSDFINNFSHEFKTPIVSIAGLAKVIQKGNLSEEEKQQYLKAIEEESMRLSAIATNVLNLTKVENQTILSEVSSFNLSEQIRSGVLLLENKWEKKNIDLQLDFEEYMIEANEELLKQVWINLIDNAVKFANENGTVAITVQGGEDEFSVWVSNTGSEIPPEKQEKIFNKFYQGDESHSTEGNGIGLAIVKKIVELHGGTIEVESGDMKTTFIVTLPRNQEE